jgi:hypothetical protein
MGESRDTLHRVHLRCILGSIQVHDASVIRNCNGFASSSSQIRRNSPIQICTRNLRRPKGRMESMWSQPFVALSCIRCSTSGHSNSIKFRLKFSPDKADTMIVQANALLDDLDKEINIYAIRVKVCDSLIWIFEQSCLGMLLLAFPRDVQNTFRKPGICKGGEPLG